MLSLILSDGTIVQFHHKANESFIFVPPSLLVTKDEKLAHMAQNHTGKFTRKGPDVVSEELAVVLFGNTALEFKPLFTLVYAKLRARNVAGGGEEMLRLRVYEKLQGFVSKGMVDKKITAGVKEYLGNASLSAALPVASDVPVIVA